MRDEKLIKVLAEYLAKCAEIHAEHEPIPSESLEDFIIDVVSCLNVRDECTELIPLKRHAKLSSLQGVNLNGSVKT